MNNEQKMENSRAKFGIVRIVTISGAKTPILNDDSEYKTT